MTLVHTVTDYARAILSALPRGRIWPRDDDTAHAATARGLAPTLQRLDARAAALLVDAFPGTAFELLPEWEASLGLPDPCAGEEPSLQLRRAQVVARLTASGGQSVTYFVQVAAALGYTITIQEYAPARFGVARFGEDRFEGEAFAHLWTVHAPSVTVSYARFGENVFGDHFIEFGNAVLECELSALKPAHTILTFQYA